MLGKTLTILEAVAGIVGIMLSAVCLHPGDCPGGAAASKAHWGGKVWELPFIQRVSEEFLHLYRDTFGPSSF